MIFQFKLDVNDGDKLEFFADGVNSAAIILAYDDNGNLLVNFVLDGVSICHVDESYCLSRAEVQAIYNCSRDAIAFRKTIRFKYGYVGYGAQVAETQYENQILN